MEVNNKTVLSLKHFLKKFYASSAKPVWSYMQSSREVLIEVLRFIILLPDFLSYTTFEAAKSSISYRGFSRLPITAILFAFLFSILSVSFLPINDNQAICAVPNANNQAMTYTQDDYERAKKEIISRYTLKNVMTKPAVRNAFMAEASMISQTFQLAKCLPRVYSQDQFEDYQFAHKFKQEEILNNPAKVREFLDLFCEYESKFIQKINSETSYMTYDGYWLNIFFDMFGDGSIRNWSAASKEAQELGLLIKLLAVDPNPLAVKLFGAASAEEAKNEAIDLAKKKINLYLQFNKDFPAFAGFIPWFREDKDDSTKIAPSDDWLNAFPTLDNGEFFWMIFIMWHMLDKLYKDTGDATIDTIANQYKEYFKIITNNIPIAAYFEPSPYPDVIGYMPTEIEIKDTSLDTVKKSNYKDRQYGTGYYLNDMYEGFMMLMFANLFCKGLDSTQQGSLLGNVAYEKVELSEANGDSCDATLWKGHWNSAHEEWAWMFLPYVDNDVAQKLFDVRQKVRSIYSRYGYNSSINQPGREAYVSECGIPKLPEKAYKHEVLYPEVYAPSAAWPVVLNDLFQNKTLEKNSHGLAAFLHMIQPKGIHEKSQQDTVVLPHYFTMQGPRGFLEAYDKDGHVSMLKTVDGSYLLYLAMLDGTYQECREALKNTYLYYDVLDWYSRYSGFKKAWNSEIDSVFGSDPNAIIDPGDFRQLEAQIDSLIDPNFVPPPVTTEQNILKKVWRFPGKDRWRGNAKIDTEEDTVVVVSPLSSDGWGWVSGGTYEDIVPDTSSAFLIKGIGEFKLKLETFKHRKADFINYVVLQGKDTFTRIDLKEAIDNQYFIITLDSIRSKVTINEFWYDPDGDGIVNAVDNNRVILNSMHLAQNYPNPFNPITTIEFTISKTSKTKLIIYDILGRVVKILLNEEVTPGNYKIKFDSSSLPSGVYLYQLITSDYKKTRKMLLIK